MASMSFKYTMEEKKPIFTTASETMATNTTETYTAENRSGTRGSESVFSPLAPSFHSRNGGDLSNILNITAQEPRTADTAPTSIDIDHMLMNLRMNGSEIQFDDVDQNSHSNYFMGENAQSMGSGRAESMSSNIWGDGSSSSSSSAARTGEMIDTFDFFVKSLSSANNYVSMLTREQLSVLRSIRPSLLYEFLQEVVKVRSDKRMRRALPNECAFCKNNGENEDCYSSHALKDWRGRVLCPVLRAFRCPRCGATGDRAHTIKYCPENSDGGLERSGSFASRRRVPSSSLLMGQQPPRPSPSPSPSTGSMSHSSLWNTFGIN